MSQMSSSRFPFEVLHQHQLCSYRTESYVDGQAYIFQKPDASK